MKVGTDTVVTISYELWVEEPEQPPQLIERRDSQNSIDFLFGQEVVLPVIEKSLLGKTAGFKTSLLLDSSQAYGEWKKEMETWLPRAHFPKGMDLRIGMKFQTQGPAGDVISVVVKEIKENEILIDGNHPLAGLTIRFQVEILRVRAATSDEISQGKVLKIFH